jgi:hypothetical protein
MTDKSDIFLGNGDISRFQHPVSIVWNPQPDITPYELARLLPIVCMYGPLMPYQVPTEPELLRHLIVNDPNKENNHD